MEITVIQVMYSKLNITSSFPSTTFKHIEPARIQTNFRCLPCCFYFSPSLQAPMTRKSILLHHIPIHIHHRCLIPFGATLIRWAKQIHFASDFAFGRSSFNCQTSCCPKQRRLLHATRALTYHKRTVKQVSNDETYHEREDFSDHSSIPYLDFHLPRPS